MPKRIADNLFSFALLVFGIILFVSAQSIETGAAMGKGGDFMPKLCSGIWLVISLILFVDGCRKSMAESGEQMKITGFVTSLVLLVLYVFLLKPVGFVIVSIAYLMIQMVLFVPESKRTKKNYILFAVISVVVPIAVNLLFANAFSLILPAGILK